MLVISPSMPPMESMSPPISCPLDEPALVSSLYNYVDIDIDFLLLDPTLNLKALTIHKGKAPPSSPFISLDSSRIITLRKTKKKGSNHF